ncbi:MAG TPA: hypothetical protein VJ343_02850 [archaeon]|nr:hypothetical protein [archaeon]
MERINLQQIFEDGKKIYEISSDVKMLQEDLENMIDSIEKNVADCQKGKIPEEFFRLTDDKLKKESATLIKKINAMIEDGLRLISKIKNEAQRHEAKKSKHVEEG